MKTPKQKAKELFNTFQDELWNGGYRISKPMIKKCALICVDEILGIVDLANKKYNTGLGAGFQLKQEKYWKNVRNEIEKL